MTARPTTSAAASPVITAAAGFQSLTTPRASTSKTPSRDRAEHARGLRTLLDLPVQERALDGGGDPAGQLLGERELGARVPAGQRGRERDRAENAVAALERHADAGGEPGLA